MGLRIDITGSVGLKIEIIMFSSKARTLKRSTTEKNGTFRDHHGHFKLGCYQFGLFSSFLEN